jgi:hypothetical protein
MVECLNGFKSRANNLNDLVLAMVDQRCQTCSNTLLIVGNENAHAWGGRTSHAKRVFLWPAGECFFRSL